MLGNDRFSDLLFRPRRRYLPHHNARVTQSVTFRLVDALPKTVLARWERDLAGLPPSAAVERRRQLVDEYLDRGHGECLLARPDIAELVATAFEYFDGSRYTLHGYTVMPNHTHTLFTPLTEDLPDIVQSWKSFTSKRANAMLGRRGKFWQDDYFDRYMRDDDHFERVVRYIDENPVEAGLVARPEDWPWGSAGRRGRGVRAGEPPRRYAGGDESLVVD